MKIKFFYKYSKADIGVLLLTIGFPTMIFGVFQTIVTMNNSHYQTEWKILVLGLLILLLSDEFIKSKKDAQYIYKKFQLTHNDNKANIFVYCIPLLALSFFLYKGLNNNFSYLNGDKGEEVLLTCPEGYTLKNIVFQ